MAATEDENGSPMVLLFGGTARTDEAHDTALGDSWAFADGKWMNLNLAPPHAPYPRWGHSLACTPPSWLEPGAGPPSCTLFGGARLSEDDHFSDTWVWTRLAAPAPPPGPSGHNWLCYKGKCYPEKGKQSKAECTATCTGSRPPLPGPFDAPSTPATIVEATTSAATGSFGWKQSQPGTSNPGAQPVGRWSFQLASCGSGTLMSSGSIGYRICTDDTWVFNASVTPSTWGAAHDAVGIWQQQQPAGESPGFLGGAMLARVDDAVHGKGVLVFGGVSFEGKIGESNQTWFWPAARCPTWK